jgi:hypothetical protein
MSGRPWAVNLPKPFRAQSSFSFLLSRQERLLLQRSRFASDCGGVCKLRDWTVMAHQGVAAATVPVTFSTFFTSVRIPTRSRPPWSRG